MYILKVTAKKENEETSVEAKASIESSLSQQAAQKDTSIYDEIKELIVNPNCPTRILLDYVCEQLQIDKDAEMDFCDETGRLANIKTLKNWEYATAKLQPRSTYIVILFRSKAYN